jgi:hypothetical protein
MVSSNLDHFGILGVLELVPEVVITSTVAAVEERLPSVSLQRNRYIEGSNPQRSPRMMLSIEHCVDLTTVVMGSQ